MQGSHIVKIHHAFLRGRLLEATKQMLNEFQYGGLPGRGTDLASLQLRSMMSVAKSRNRSLLILFADLKPAFYTIARALLTKIAQTEDQFNDY